MKELQLFMTFEELDKQLNNKSGKEEDNPESYTPQQRVEIAIANSSFADRHIVQVTLKELLEQGLILGWHIGYSNTSSATTIGSIMLTVRYNQNQTVYYYL